MGSYVTCLAPQFPTTNELDILIIGLDNSGSTTILNQLKYGENRPTKPTVGYNVEYIQYKDQHLKLWDAGGKIISWRDWYVDTYAVVLVVDSTDKLRIDEARKKLHDLLADDNNCVRDSKLLIFANKQDKPTAMTLDDMQRRLRLTSRTLRNRKYLIIPCIATTGAGIQQGMDWLFEEDGLGNRQEIEDNEETVHFSRFQV